MRGNSRTIDAYASLPHFKRHLAPIVDALTQNGTQVRCWSRGGETDWPVLKALEHEAVEIALVASYDDAQRFQDKPVIYSEHGAGQTYVGVREEGYSGSPGLDQVTLFLCPNEHVAARWRRRYPRAAAVVTGDPALDLYFQSGRAAAAASPTTTRPEPTRPAPEPSTPNDNPPRGDGSIVLRRGQPIIAFTSHFRCSICPESMPALPYFEASLPTLLEDLRGAGYEPLGTAHPRARGPQERLWRSLGVRFEPDPDVVLREASLLVADNTSLMYAAAAIGTPVVALNAPWYRRDVKHGLRFWDYVPGIECDEPEDLWWTIRAALAGGYVEQRVRAADRTYALRDGCAAERAAEAITLRSALH